MKLFYPTFNSTGEKNPYRYGKVKQINQKKAQKLAKKDILKFNIIPGVLTVPFHIHSIGIMFSTLHTIIWDFFLIQFNRKLHLNKIPIKNVDHPLDKKVPFEPERVDVYLSFIHFWISPLAMLIKRYGPWNGTKICREFLHYLKLAYKEAARMYKQSLTTTRRPKYTKTGPFKTIHMFDPHYCCVPSLHIAIICLVYSFYRMIFERENFSQEEKLNWNQRLYTHAVDIADTVLYIKQHSVNCIPAALYLMTTIAPEFFTKEDALQFTDDLFTRNSTVPSEDAQQIRNHITNTFNNFYTEGQKLKDKTEWTKPIVEWLSSYVPCAE